MVKSLPLPWWERLVCMMRLDYGPDLQRRRSAGLAMLALVLSVAVAALGAKCVAANPDEAIRKWVISTDKGLIDGFMGIVTYLGDGFVDYAIAGVLSGQKARISAQRAVLASGAAALALKFAIGMKRPPGPIEFRPFCADPSYHAMPSGHTVTTFALATIIADYYPEYRNLAYFLATLVGISRLYEDAHWFSNVIAGAGLGYISAKFVEIHW